MQGTLFNFEEFEPPKKEEQKKDAIQSSETSNNQTIINEEKKEPVFVKPTDYLAELNEIQRKAVESTDGPVMIIAGPGSGKTRVLTYRIAHLIDQGKAPWKILALTFTNKAAKEMKERIQHIVGPYKAAQLKMGTFHSVFAQILRVEADWLGYPSNFTIYDTEDTKSLIKTIIKEQNLNKDIYTPGMVYGRISNAKNLLITPAVYLNDKNIQASDLANRRPHLGKIYAAYRERCRRAGAMDFDDLLVNMFELFYRNPNVLEKYQERFQYLHIDEFQDTNHVQYRIVRMLAKNHKNICVVGDDAQSIYAFRGATIENILHFKSDYPACQEYKLEQNYRSTKNIVDIANNIIKRNSNQIPKTIWTENQSGNKTKLIQSSNDSDEGRLVVDSINIERLRNHYKNEDFAILYRTNSQSRIMEEALRKKGIPYRIYGGLSFYQRKEIKDIMAYLRVLVNPNDEEALKRVINYPTRGIGKTTMDKVGKIALTKEVPIWEILTSIGSYKFTKNTQGAILRFVRMMMNFQVLMNQVDAYEVARRVATETKLLEKLHKDKSVEGLNRYENIQEFFSSIQEFVDNKKAGVVNEASDSVDSSLGAYLQEVSLLTDMDNDKEDNDKVKLMTIHAAKGLEFPCVYVVGMEEELFPSAMAMKSQNGLEEERRLFYVAVTRAKQKLTLSYAKQRYRFGKIQYCNTSRFLDEISPFHIEKIGGFKFNSVNNASYNSFKSSIQSNISSAKKLAANKARNAAPIIKNFKSSNANDLREGMLVVHQRFKQGRILSIEGRGDKRIAIIRFMEYGEKRIMLKFAKLMIVNE